MKQRDFQRISRIVQMLSNMVLIMALLLPAFLSSYFPTGQTVKASGGHSHGRFGHITWEYKVGDPPNTARITFVGGFRRNGFTCSNPVTGASVPCSVADGLPGVGDIVSEFIGGTQINNFGDGTSTPILYFKVFSVNIPGNWLMARALQPGSATQEYISHTYAGPGPYTLVSASCCRTEALVFPNAHINNAGLSYRYETIIDFSTRSSPISLLPPIVDCPRESICTFRVAAVDPDAGDPEAPANLQWRPATATEMGGTDLSSMPPGASINPDNGEYTWDTRGAALGPDGYNTLYSTQIVIEDRVLLQNGNLGNLKSRVAVDFFIRIVDLPGPPSDLIAVPVRWCGLIGSPSVDTPGQYSNYNSLEEILDQRLIDLSHRIYGPEAQITFFPAPREAGYPTFEGPRPGGDFDVPNAGTDSRKAINRCRQEWQATDPDAEGLIAINLNRFVAAGTDSNQYWGYSLTPDKRRDVGHQLSSAATIIDNGYFVSPPAPSNNGTGVQDARQKWLGHEVAHALTLVHLAEIDPDGIVVNDPANNIMLDQGNGSTAAYQLEPAQREVVRTQAILIPGARQIGAPPPPGGGTRADAILDTPAGQGFVDLDITGLAMNSAQSETNLTVSTFDLFPSNAAGLSYYFAVDLDNQATTGGSPSVIGAPYTTQGMDLVGLVQVNVVNNVAQGTPTLWKYQNGQFVQLSDPRIRASVDTQFGNGGSELQTGGNTPTPVAQIIQLILPNDLRGPIATSVRVATIAKNPATNTVDSVEGPMNLAPPTYPSCQVAPDGALLGSTVHITASNLLANRLFNVYLGGQTVASGTTDASGNAALDANIPTNVITGTQIVSVHVVGTGVSAFCPVQLWSTPKFNSPPSPADGTAFTINVGQTLQIPIQASDPDTEAGDVVTLDAIGLPAGANFPVSGPANPASATFAWTPTIDQVGSYVVIFTARDSLELSSPPLSVTITVQPAPLACTPSNAYGSLQSGGAKFASLTASNATNFQGLPLYFVPNWGQEHQMVRFQARGMGGNLFFSPSEVVLSLPNPDKAPAQDTGEQIRYDLHAANVVRIHYQGANKNPEIVPLEQLSGVVNILKGSNPAQWQPNLPTYSGIAYREIYPGIELRYEGTNGQLKSTFYVAPGADPSVIGWRYKGASAVNIDGSGNLAIGLPEPAGAGTVLTEQAPIAWQEVNGKRVAVAVRYALSKNDKAGFVFPNGYDPALPLVIDPTLSYSTYLGGTTTDQGEAITLDADCNIYITGVTYSTNFPTASPMQTNQPLGDVFVTKLNPAGDTLLHSTYIGGSGGEHAWDIALDSQGRITIVGETESSNFPRVNAYDTTYGGGTCPDDVCDDVFVAQLLADGSALRYSTYMGGNKDDEGLSLVVGPDDMIYVAGWTGSTGFPKKNAYDSTFGGGTCDGQPCEDAFVAKINPAAAGTSSLLYSTFLGGNNYDRGTSIALDDTGHVYVTGFTRSTNYPTLGAYQSVLADNSDIFVTKLDPALVGTASLLYSTYFGGTGSDHAYGIALNGANQVYLTGWTRSADLPLANAFDSSFGGGTCGTTPCFDAYLTHLDIGSNTLVSSSYLGGTNEELGADITLDNSGSVYVTGYTRSTNFPTVAAIQPVKGTDSCNAPPCADAFVAKVDPTGSSLIYSTYLGGGDEDYGSMVVVDGLGGAYIVGYTFSSNFPTTPGSFPYVGGSSYADAFVVKIED